MPRLRCSAGKRWSTTSYVIGQRDATGEVDHGGEQTAAGERGGLQAAGQVAELLDGESELGDGPVDLDAEDGRRVR